MSKQKRNLGDTEKQVIEMIDDFVIKVQTENRSIEKHGIFTWLQKIAKIGAYDSFIKDVTLYRARLIGKNDNICNTFPFEGFDAKNSMQPPREKTFAMRANYERIPYLYCSSSAYGAMSEIRPYVNAEISLAEIKVIDELKCFKLDLPATVHIADESAFVEKYLTLLVRLSNMFQKPVEVGENGYDYYPTQRIAEYIKNLGYDAIIYKSALDVKAYNYCIFNYEKCDAISTRIYNTTGLTYDFIQNEKSQHEEELDNRGKVAQLASAIYKSICGDQLPNNISTIKKLENVLIKITGDKNYH